jgi:hypothetical protein
MPMTLPMGDPGRLNEVFYKSVTGVCPLAQDSHGGGGSAGVTPRQRILGVVAVLLVVGAVSGITATALGWEPVGPAALPVRPELASPPGPGAVDRGEFVVQGATFAALLFGSPGHWQATLVHTGGAGGRIAAEGGSIDSNGALVVDLGGATNLTLRTYRESWIGVWRAEPITLRFNATS